jgi:hypothetical protein
MRLAKFRHEVTLRLHERESNINQPISTQMDIRKHGTLEHSQLGMSPRRWRSHGSRMGSGGYASRQIASGKGNHLITRTNIRGAAVLLLVKLFSLSISMLRCISHSAVDKFCLTSSEDGIQTGDSPIDFLAAEHIPVPPNNGIPLNLLSLCHFWLPSFSLSSWWRAGDTPTPDYEFLEFR